jgi:hypothetical protein
VHLFSKPTTSNPGLFAVSIIVFLVTPSGIGILVSAGKSCGKWLGYSQMLADLLDK